MCGNKKKKTKRKKIINAKIKLQDCWLLCCLNTPESIRSAYSHLTYERVCMHVRLCMCVCVCVLVRPFSSAQGLSHTRLMAGVEVLKWMLQFLQTEPIHQI